MKYLKLLLYVLLPIYCWECSSGSGYVSRDDDYRGHFHWKGYIDSVNSSTIWNINCDIMSCAWCKAISYTNDTIILDPGVHKPIFTKCMDLPASSIIIDTIKTDTTITDLGEVVFKMDGDKYGMDYWYYDYPTYRKTYLEKVSYRSIEAGDSARVMLILTPQMTTIYKKVVAVLEDSTANYVSFSHTADVDTIQLTPVTNYITIHAGTSVPNETKIELSVHGITDPADPACLAGDCFGKGDRIQLVIYNKKTLTNNHLYYVNNPDSQPTAARWKKEFNEVLKQAVVEIDTVYASALGDTSWDINHNGMVDCPIGLGMLDSVTYGNNVIWNELGRLLPDTDQCYSNVWSSSFILKRQLRMHYILEMNAYIGDTILFLNTIEGLTVNNMSLRLSPFYSPNSIEYLLIEAIDTANNSIEFKNMKPLTNGLEKNYNISDAITASTDELAAGYTPKAQKNQMECASCSFTSSRPFKTYIHEFLHQFKNGNLKHVGDEADSTQEIDNIMHPSSSRKGSRLRYRTLPAYHIHSNDLNQNQWSQLQ